MSFQYKSIQRGILKEIKSSVSSDILNLKMEKRYLPIRAKLPAYFSEQEKESATLLLVELAQLYIDIEREE